MLDGAGGGGGLPTSESKGRSRKINRATRPKFTCLQAFSDMEVRDKPWTFVLETLALKKTANDRIFAKISEELEAKLVANGVSSSKEDKSFRIEQL